MHLHFTATESTVSYFEATPTYLERHGKSVAFYSDMYSVFHKLSQLRKQAAQPHLGPIRASRAYYRRKIQQCTRRNRALAPAQRRDDVPSP
ncbi:transposase-like protein [Burkholderia ambifaria AMMD]|uniref:Transposase-like protein n=1 Tax=Burkholderia ambifaria (strain ATCC BAA-244 / DSM 16087 / CCUG 44356 / LMG 19182 / AMMD) TaxID=339670 RepID=Q0B1A7_BURCM|nr:transposase-like protein [Burkholderia ambifaria AMMD]